MGTSQSRGRQEQYIQVNHPRFSNSKIVSINSVKVLETQINTQEKSYERWRSSISSHNIDPKKYRFLLLPLKDSNIDKCAVCTNRRNVTATYDNYPLLLTDAIDFLRNKRSTFSEPELWHLLYAICAAEEEISSINGHESKLGDVRPQNVFLSEKGKIKLANEYSWPGQFNSYEKLLDGQSSYLAPEDMEDLRNGAKRPDLGTNESSELFAVGLTMLSAGNLKENGDLYDTHKMVFDKPEFLRRINFWLTRQRYSENLRILVAYLCSLRVYKRWSFSELWRWLSKHRAKIGAHEFSGNEVELPQPFKQETEELKLNAPLLAELPQTYTNQLYKEYEPRNVLSDKTEKEIEAEQEIMAINLRKSNVSNKPKNHRSYVSPNKNLVLLKGKEEKNNEEEKKNPEDKKNPEQKNNPEPKSIQTSRVEDAKIRELIELVEQQRLAKLPEKSAVDPVVSTVDPKEKKESPSKHEQKSFVLDGTTSQVKPVEIENGNINIPFISNNPPKNPSLEKDLAYSYPYHPQFYNPHVRYVSPSRKIEPAPPNKQPIFFTYSQVGLSQAKSQVKPKEDNKNPKKSIAGSNAGSQVSSQKVIIEHKVQKINSPKKGLNDVATVKKEEAQGKNEANRSNKSGKSEKQAPNVEKNLVSIDRKGQNPSNNKVNPTTQIQIVQSQVVQKQETLISRKKPVEAEVDQNISNQNEQKPAQDPKTPIKKEIAETNSSRLRKSGSSVKSQALKKSDELSKNGKGVESSKKIIVTTNKITTKKSIQKSAGETGIKKEEEPNTKGKNTQKSIKSIKQPSIPGIDVDINSSSNSISNNDKTKDPTSLKVIKERPPALIGVAHDKAKSPVSSPVLSPKSKLPIPSSPKGTSNKLAVSAVVPTDNSASKPTNKFAMSTVSRKEGQHIYLKTDIQMPKKDAKAGGVTKIRSIKQIEPKSIIKKAGQEKEANIFVNKEGGGNQKLIGDKKPIFEVNNKSLLQSKVVITSRVQPSLIVEEPAQQQVEEKKQLKQIDRTEKNDDKKKPVETEKIKEKYFEDHGIFSLQTLINKKPEDKKYEIIEEPTYENQFKPKGKKIDEKQIKVPSAEISVPHVEVPKTRIELPQAEISVPHVEVPKTRIELPQAEISVPHVEVPKTHIELPQAEISVPHVEVSKTHIELPQAEISVPHVEVPKTRIELPQAEISVPHVEVPKTHIELPQAEISVPHVEVPKTRIELPQAEISVPHVEVPKTHIELPQAEISVPHVEVPKTRIELPQAEISVPHVEVPKTHIELPQAEISVPHVEVPKTHIELPQAEISVPHVEVPKTRIELPQAEISVPHVEVPKTHIELPQAEISVPHVEVPKTRIELPQAEISVPHVEVPKTHIELPQAEISVPHVEVPKTHIELPQAEISVPHVEVPKTHIELPQAEISVPHVEVPKTRIELPQAEISVPHVEVPKTRIELPQAEISVPHVEVPKTHIELPQAEISVPHVEVPKTPLAEISLPHAQFLSINTSSHHIPEVSSAQISRQLQLPTIHKPFIPINQPEISPILIVDETSYPSELEHIISPKNQKTINSNIPASSQSLPNVVQPFEHYPSPINKKKNTITSQSDVDQQYLQYFEHEQPKVVQPKKKSVVNVPTPTKKEAIILPQPSSPSKIVEEPKENKSTEKRSVSNPASQKKFKINEQVLKYDIAPQQQKKESPPKSERSIKQISPAPSAKALSQKKSTISQAKLDIKYAQVVPVDNKSFNLSIVQYENKPKSKIQSKIEEKPKSTISKVEEKPKSTVDQKKSTASKVDQKPKSRILTREEEKKPMVTKIEDKPKPKIQPRIEDKPKSATYKIEEKPKTKLQPRAEDKPRSTVSKFDEKLVQKNETKAQQKKSAISKVQEKPKSRIIAKEEEKKSVTSKVEQTPRSKNEQKKPTISKIEEKPKSRISAKEEEKKSIISKVDTPKSKIQVKVQEKKPIISKVEEKSKSKIQTKVQEKKSTIYKVEDKLKSRIQARVEEKKSTINLIDLQRKSIKSENKIETGSKIIEKLQPSKLNELVPQISQKAKTRSERIFDKKEIAPPIQIEIPEPSQKSSVVKVVPKGSNIVEKKSEIDMKKLDVTPVKISPKKSQIKQDDARSQARSRLSAISQQKSDRSHLSRKSRKRIDFQHEGHIDFKFISTAQLDKKSVSGQDIKFIKNPTESGGNDNHIEAQLIHLRRLGSDGKSVHSFRDRKDIHFKHDADDEARYSIRDGAEENKPKNIVEVNDKYRNMTPNKLITKDRTRSQKFIGLRQEIQSQKTIRYPHDDAPVINILERWKLEKIQENSKVSEKKEVSKEGTKKQESKISFDNNQSGLSKLAKEKSEIEAVSKKSQASEVKKSVALPKVNVEVTPKPAVDKTAPKNELKPTPVAAPAKPSSNMDMIDDLLGFNRQPIRRQRNQDVKAAPEKEIHSPAKVETQRKEIKSAPKEIGSENSKKIVGINKETSIIKEIKQDNGSKAEGDTKSQMRLTRFQQRTPQQSQVQHRQFRRKSRKHIDFQHDGHIDFKFIEKVKLDGKASSILQNEVKFIKNASQSAGDSNHIEAEIIHLRNLGTDGKSIRSYRDIKDIKFKHDADDEVQYSIKEGTEQSHIRNLVTVGQNYLTPNKDTFKERTKTQVFNVKDNPASQTVRVARKTERFTSQKSGLASKLLSSVEPVLEIESPVKEKESEHKSSNIIPVAIESKKEITRTTPNRLQSRPGYNNDLIDDLLGFGKPKRQEQVQPKPAPVIEQKSTFADKFIEEVKETNRIIRDQKNQRN